MRACACRRTHTHSGFRVCPQFSLFPAASNNDREETGLKKKKNSFLFLLFILLLPVFLFSFSFFFSEELKNFTITRKFFHVFTAGFGWRRGEQNTVLFLRVRFQFSSFEGIFAGFSTNMRFNSHTHTHTESCRRGGKSRQAKKMSSSQNFHT